MPRILGGDFRDLVHNWQDPFAGDPRPTFRQEYLPPGAVAHRVDYVLVQGQVTGSDLMFGGPALSDHLAPTVRVRHASAAPTASL